MRSFATSVVSMDWPCLLLEPLGIKSAVVVVVEALRLLPPLMLLPNKNPSKTAGPTNVMSEKPGKSNERKISLIS